jgi:hypothetical protein
MNVRSFDFSSEDFFLALQNTSEAERCVPPANMSTSLDSVLRGVPWLVMVGSLVGDVGASLLMQGFISERWVCIELKRCNRPADMQT